MIVSNNGFAKIGCLRFPAQPVRDKEWFVFNNFKARLAGGEPLFGTMITLPSPATAEILAAVGFDWFFIDGEHGPLGTSQVLAILQAVSHRVACIVRVPEAAEVPIKQMLDILHNKMTKRGLDIDCLKAGEIEETGGKAVLKMTVQEGLDKELSRKIVKLIKQSKMKVQAAIQGEQVRITGKKRDDLQAVMKIVKEADLGMPFQFNNFRD